MSLNVYSRVINRLSNIFQPITVIPKDACLKTQESICKSQKLMLELGIIRHGSTGSYYFLPLGMKSLEKLIRLVDEEMNKLGAQKVTFPTLTDATLWKNSGRFEEVASELFKLKDRRYHTYVLSPTHEESASELLASLGPLSYKNFPIRLYQTTSKYRDEMKPRFGLMRSRQFIMKDLYTFDVDMDSARRSYDLVCTAYDHILKRIGLDFVRVEGNTGTMGGLLSHEYHYPADIGEDEILTCKSCGYTANIQVSGREKCPQCEAVDNINITHGIEIGHTFLLGDKYSKPLKATYLNKQAKPEVLQMGSYGLGLSRMLAAAVEILSQEQEMRWPVVLAPYTVIIIPPKRGSKEESKTEQLAENLYQLLQEIPSLVNNILIDDRNTLTIGRRYLEARRVGYPYVVVIGKKAAEDPAIYEIYDINKNVQMNFNQNALLSYLKQNVVC